MHILEFVRVGKVCTRWVRVQVEIVVSSFGFGVIDLSQVELTRSICREGFVIRSGLDRTIASSLEAALFVFYENLPSKKYLQKSRSLQFNLSKNGELRFRLEEGLLSPTELIRFGPNKLATSDSLKQRKCKFSLRPKYKYFVGRLSLTSCSYCAMSAGSGPRGVFGSSGRRPSWTGRTDCSGHFPLSTVRTHLASICGSMRG